MKRNYKKSNELRCLARRMFCLTMIFCTAIAALYRGGRTFAANPASGAIAVTGPVSPFTGSWVGTLTGTPAAADGEPTCVITQAGTVGNCDNFTLTVNGTPAAWIGKRIRVRFTWTSPSTDYDMVIRRESNSIAGLQGDGLCSTEPGDCPQPFDEFAGSSGAGASTAEEAVLSPSESGVGDYYVRAIYFAASAGDQYQATVSVFDAPISSGGAPVVPPTFDNYQPPVGYPRRDGSGEPSIGINWNTGNVMTMSRLRCNRTSFSDVTSPADPTTGAIWFSRSSPAIVTGFDPILFTDSITGRTICGELQVAAGTTNGIISDDDLTTATATFQTGGPTQGVDHQSIGGGPPKPGITGREPTGTYPHLFYYASQQTAYAAVATSLDGGLTYLPAVPAYTLAQCTNLHGHLKVSSDGTVYLPNRSCGGHAAVIVSEDNGLNWSIRPVPTSSAGGSDPSVGIGAGGRLYLGYMNGSERPHVAVSNDRGLTWNIDVDLGALVPGGLRAAVFAQVVAGDNNRAAIFFIATNSTDPLDPVGDDNGGAGPNFKGTWYPYVGMTIDGGITWTVVRADNDPLHAGVLNPAQQGVVCLNGTVCPGPPTVPVDTRNLLDFNEVTVDSAGRVVAVYADGCNFDHGCINVNNNTADRTANQGVARITIIRQRGGSRLFSEFDAGSPSIPAAPFVEVNPAAEANLKVRKTSGNALLWGTPDDRGSRLLTYRIYRGTPGGRERIVATVRYGTNTFVDRKGTKGDYYHVTAVNRYGESRKIAKSFVKGG